MKHNSSKYKKIMLILSVMLICVALITGVRYALFTSTTSQEEEDFIAILIDGKESDAFPATSNYATSVTCTRNGKTIDANQALTWDGSKWKLSVEVTTGNVRCNTKFIQANPLYQTILADNEVKSPLTTPGLEVSAYKESEATAFSSSSVSSTYQSYYVTYGTGWEANGTKFNLTGAAVTTDTYANSYQSLVGKYLPTNSITNLILSSASSTTETMKTTTNLSYVLYVVSATQNGLTYKPISSNKNNTEALLASAEDDYGTSYYFRGTVTNNYVEFANKCWRVVRIGGDNTVKLILHNDNTSNTSNPCSSANNSDTAAFARYSGATYTSVFNSSYNDNAYVGFMYGTPGSTTYEATHANTNKSTILTNLETWYNNNLKTYESAIDDNVFCNDKNNVTDTIYHPGGSYNTGVGYGTNVTYYGATQRILSSTNTAGGTGPSLKCNGDLSKITSKIGLITADELVYAGYVAYTGGSTSYLQENARLDWYTLSPMIFDSYVSIWQVDGFYSRLDFQSVGLKSAVRPYISLSSSTNVTGEGTSENPYKVIL